MLENTPTADDYLSYSCPRCDAEPGQPCRTRTDRKAEWPHAQRLQITDPWLQRRALQLASRTRALCCQCGNLRTVSDSYRRCDDNNTRDDNQHPLGWRCTGTLKCSICRAPTRHAVLRDNCEPRFRDIAETRQRSQVSECIPPMSYEFLLGYGTE